MSLGQRYLAAQGQALSPRWRASITHRL
jgi:hypothetical protein